MSKTLMIAFAIGLVVVAVAVGTVYYSHRGAHVTLDEKTSKVLKVRTAPLDENSSVAVIDFRVTNPSDYNFMAKDVTIVLVDAAGNQTDGQTSSEMDAKRLFAGLPILGEKYNESLKQRDIIPPHGTVDRMVAARFEVPESKLAARKRFLVRVEEVDGNVNEFGETR